MSTLNPGYYKFRYRVGGILEVISVSTGDLVQGLNSAFQKTDKVTSITDKGIKFNESDMIFSIYIHIISPIKLQDWNSLFLDTLKNVFPWYQRYTQWLSFEYIDHKKTQKNIAIEQSSEPAWYESLGSEFFGGGITSYVFLFAIAGVAVYGLSKKL